MSSLADVFRVLGRMRDSGIIAEYAIADHEEFFERKRAWHQAQAKLPLREKVRILLELQKQDLPLLRRLRPLKPWERPWPIDP